MELTQVWVITTGGGRDGVVWNVVGIYTTAEKAQQGLALYQTPIPVSDGTAYIREAAIEVWPTNKNVG